MISKGDGRERRGPGVGWLYPIVPWTVRTAGSDSPTTNSVSLLRRSGQQSQERRRSYGFQVQRRHCRATESQQRAVVAAAHVGARICGMCGALPCHANLRTLRTGYRRTARHTRRACVRPFPEMSRPARPTLLSTSPKQSPIEARPPEQPSAAVARACTAAEVRLGVTRARASP